MNPLPENGHSDHFAHIEDSLNILDIMFRQVIIVHTTADVSCQAEIDKMNSMNSNYILCGWLIDPWEMW